MPSVETAVIAVDFTSCSASALRAALRLVGPGPGGLQVVHVVDFLLVTELEEAMSQHQRNVREQLLAQARDTWASFAAEIPGAVGLPFHIEIADRVQAVVRQAEARRPGTLFLGAYGVRRVHVGLGTVATACVRHSPSDVMLVREGHDLPFRDVVACVDFSETSSRALDRAAWIASHDGATLHVMHLFDPPWLRLHYRAPTLGTDPAFQQQYRATLQGMLERLAGSLREKYASTPVRCEVFEWRGHRSGIVAYSEMVDADLVVLGTHGRGNVRDVLLGSTAEKVLRDAGCSILAVRPAAGGA